MTPAQEIKLCEKIIANAKSAKADADFRQKQALARIKELRRIAKSESEDFQHAGPRFHNLSPK